MPGYNGIISGGGFHHVAIRVADFDKSVGFYTNGLGFKKHISWGEGDDRKIMLDTGDGNFLEIYAGGKANAAFETVTNFPLKSPPKYKICCIFRTIFFL